MNYVLENILTIGIPVILAITLHEAAHGYVARYFGDRTAEQLGRITLNPIRHIDPIGTLLIPVLILLFSSGAFLFGYAKPVPVNPRNFKNPRRDMAWVALAGPAANLAMALFWTLILKIAFTQGLADNTFWVAMAGSGILVNLVLIVLNLLPIPPLDGGRVAVGFLPVTAAAVLNRIEPYGFFIVLILLFTNILNTLMLPAIAFLMRLLAILFSVYPS